MTAEMTPKERFLATARLEKPDQVPACPWLTSAFYSNYYGVDPAAYYEDRDLQLRAMLEFYGDRYPDMQYFPGFRGSSGSTIEASALGCEIVTHPGQTPHANPVVHDLRRDVPKLKVPDPEKDGRMPMVLEHFAWLADRLPEHGFEVTAGFLHAPFDVALLVRGATDLMMELLLDPEGVHAMMDVITETCIQYINKQYEAVGGTMVQIMFSDDSGARLSPSTGGISPGSTSSGWWRGCPRTWSSWPTTATRWRTSSICTRTPGSTACTLHRTSTWPRPSGG